MSETRITDALAEVDAGLFGRYVHFFPEVGSTNDLARDFATQGAPEGTTVIADHQTSGRGRISRRWVDPPGTSLLMSTIFRPTIPPGQANRLVMICGLAIAEAVESVAPVRVDVKWPNDLQITSLKFVGILPESAVIGDQLDWVIVGMGINVNQIFDPGDPLSQTATSLRLVTGREHDRASLLANILARINHWYARLASPELVAAWRDRCVTLGRQVKVEMPGGVLVGLADELDQAGALWLLAEDGRRHRLTLGEVTLLRTANETDE